MIESIEKLKKEFERIRKEGYVPFNGKGSRAVGTLFERLIGKEDDELPIPDYEGIEIKTKYVDGEHREVGLFCCVPDGYIDSLKDLINTYGYPDHIDPTLKAFNCIFNAKDIRRVGNYFFKINVDKKNKKVILEIYNRQGVIIDNTVSWTFDILKEYIERKLQYLAFIEADRYWNGSQVYFWYNKITFYKLTSFERFIELFEKGHIVVKILLQTVRDGNKKGKIHNSGPSFAIDDFEHLNLLFDKIE